MNIHGSLIHGALFAGKLLEDLVFAVGGNTQGQQVDHGQLAEPGDHGAAAKGRLAGYGE